MNRLHEPHPRIRAEDWRSPLVRRLLQACDYADGDRTIAVSIKATASSSPMSEPLTLTWTGLRQDFERCINSYQDPVITEFASLALACILVHDRAKMQITEVTRRGEKVDYWLGDRELLIEIAGREDGDIDELCTRKANDQLLKNPMERDGYVCVAQYKTGSAKLWFFAFPEVGT